MDINCYKHLLLLFLIFFFLPIFMTHLFVYLFPMPFYPESSFFFFFLSLFLSWVKFYTIFSSFHNFLGVPWDQFTFRSVTYLQLHTFRSITYLLNIWQSRELCIFLFSGPLFALRHLLLIFQAAKCKASNQRLKWIFTYYMDLSYIFRINEVKQ